VKKTGALIDDMKRREEFQKAAIKRAQDFRE
jgi:hypothetical protein